jgi:hypothetical protein
MRHEGPAPLPEQAVLLAQMRGMFNTVGGTWMGLSMGRLLREGRCVQGDDGMNRAEKRRAQRASGYRRAKGKSGRRAAIRTPQPQEAPRLDALAAKGFVVAKPKLHLPGDK